MKRADLTRRDLLGATVLAGGALLAAQFLPRAASAAAGPMSKGEEWRSYAGGKDGSKYSPLDQIDAGNFDRLKVAWTWRSPDEAITQQNPDLQTWVWEATPLMIGGVLYVSTSMSQVAAIDAESGATLWVHDPGTWKNGKPSNNGFVHRGVEYWADGEDQRILIGTGDAYLICLDAKTGKPVESFGNGGRIDLTEGLGRPVDRSLYGVSSPPIVCRDVVVMGSKVEELRLKQDMPPGDIRGFDVRTGKQLWQFHSIPREGEFGNDTWKGESWKTAGAANVWTLMGADEELGYVYLPFGTTTNDHYGIQRPGDGLFGDCLVALDARTGERVWHFQMARHGLWDYDLPSGPNLVDVTLEGKVIKAVAQVSKQGFVYVFDRATGAPVWPIEDRPVPRSGVPGEESSPTQPFPTRPAPFDRQGVTVDDLADFTPDFRVRAQEVLERYAYGPLYTPPSLEKPTIMMPGIAGGASWSGAAVDPETGRLFVSSITQPYAMTLERSEEPGIGYTGKRDPVDTVDGIPIWKPPYGRVTAIDMNTGDHAWMSPVGDLAKDIAAENPMLRDMGLPPVGRPARGHLLVTKSLLMVGQEGSTQRESTENNRKVDTIAPTLLAYDKGDGRLVGEVAVPRNVTGAPMTYLVGGRQFIVFPTGGSNLPTELIALHLADPA